MIYQDVFSVMGIKNHRSRDCRGVKAISKREACSRRWAMQDLPPKPQVGIKTLCETHSVGSKALCSAALAFCQT